MAYRRHVVLEDSASVGRQWRWRRRLASTRLHDKVWPPRSRVCACVRVAVHTCVSHEGTGCACVRACVCKRACRACVRAHMRAGLCEGVNAQGTHRHPGAVGDRWTKRAMEATPSSGWQSWVHRRRRETTASMRDAGLRGARGVVALLDRVPSAAGFPTSSPICSDRVGFGCREPAASPTDAELPRRRPLSKR